jgi:TetR/AcrR family transcriptional repressor of lmrAB and yxaGH operons
MRKGEITRGELITATGRLLAQKGVNGTGLAEILKVSGAPKGSLYFHFPGGKDELTCAALKDAATHWRAHLQDKMRPAESASGAIVLACDFLARRLERSEFKLGCPLATTTLEVAAENEEIRAVCAHHFTSWIAFLSELFTAYGMSAERAPAWATLVLSSIEGALVLSRAERKTEPLHTCGTLLAALLDEQTRTEHL